MGIRRAGRPRLHGMQRPGATPEEQILDAAAELFAARGYAGTSTRAIAETAGLRQPSLYYYFAGKQEILARLVRFLWQPALAYGRQVAAVDAAPDARLYALLSYDIEVLRSLPWNLGSLFFSPELRASEFSSLYEERFQLREVYRGFIRDGASSGVLGLDDPDFAADLLFGLTESVVDLDGGDHGKEPAQWGIAVADSGLRLLGALDPSGARAAGLALRASLAGSEEIPVSQRSSR
jgi:AcrR family transcriptional regulator